MNNKPKRKRRIRYSKVRHTHTIKQVDKIGEYIKGMIMTLDELRKVLKWPSR